MDKPIDDITPMALYKYKCLLIGIYEIRDENVKNGLSVDRYERSIKTLTDKIKYITNKLNGN